MSDSYRRIYAAVRKVPRGRVATYGQIAKVAGLPGHARQVGYALHAAGDAENVPWQRIVNAKGEISLQNNPAGDLQRAMLEAEGILFDAKGRIDLLRFGWKPRDLRARVHKR